MTLAFHMSASSISAFKACPTRFRLAYREGLRPEESTEAQRMGTNWHALHEVYHKALAAWEPVDADGSNDEAGRSQSEAASEAAIDHLNTAYQHIPASISPVDWETERQILVTSFLGYLWYWQNDPVQPIVSEIAFDLALNEPRTGLPLPTKEVLRVGKIDHVVSWRGMVGNVERKSTSSSIDPSGDYWDRASKDTQVSMYAMAFRDMLFAGQLPQAVLDHPDYTPDRFGSTLYDVWHKPTIKPATLTQKDTKELLKTKTYQRQQFAVDKKSDDVIEIDGFQAEVKKGKQGIAIKETPTMYAARLLQDICTRPEFYFQRKEIARTDQDIRRFRVELFNIYQAQRLYDNTGCWFENEQQCRATFACQYIPICYGPGADAVCDGETTPPGFKRIFVDLTRNGDALPQGD